MVANCTADTFRRSFATRCLQGGMNFFILQRLMGHADLTVLKRYLALVDADLRYAYVRRAC